MALVVVGNGFCWNNEVNNKRATPALCDSTPLAIHQVLTYTYGMRRHTKLLYCTAKSRPLGVWRETSFRLIMGDEIDERQRVLG